MFFSRDHHCEFYNLSPEYFLGYTKEMKPLK